MIGTRSFFTLHLVNNSDNKKNGILAINIADVFNAPINDYVEITNPMNDFIKSKGLEYLGCIGMEMTKRFNSGAGNAKK